MNENGIFDYFSRQLIVRDINKDFQSYISGLGVQRSSNDFEIFLTEILVRIGFTGVLPDPERDHFEAMKAFNPFVHEAEKPGVFFTYSDDKVGARLLNEGLELIIPVDPPLLLAPVVAHFGLLSLLRCKSLDLDLGRVRFPVGEIPLSGNEKVMVVGAGGIGGPAIQTLLRNNLQRLVVVEPDTVSYTNLHRQPFYSVADVGKPKVRVLEKSLRPLINGELKLYDESFSADILVKERPDIVVVAVDNYESRYLINDTLYKVGIPFVDSGVGAISGYVMPHTPESSCYRCFVGDGRVDSPGPKPIIASTSYIAGMLAGAYACNCLEGNSVQLNTVYWFDLDNQVFSEFEVPKRTGCNVCGGN